jgi:hypothetical protein
MSATSSSRLTALLLLVLSLPLSAEEPASRRVQLTLLVSDHPTSQEAVGGDKAKDAPRDAAERARLRKLLIAQEASRRLRLRLDAAGVKHVEITINPNAHILLTLFTRQDRRWIEGLVLAPGELAVRPIVRAGERWATLSAQMGDELELRQEEGSMDPRDAYIWSADQRALSAFLKDHALPDTHSIVLPAAGGWRSLTLGQPIITHHDIRRVSVEQDSVGAAWARIALLPAVAQRWGAAADDTPGWAVLLDGELIDQLRDAPPEGLRAELRLRCPSSIGAPPAQRACVGQIAGRLASPIPVMLTPYKYDEPR